MQGAGLVNGPDLSGLAAIQLVATDGSALNQTDFAADPGDSVFRPAFIQPLIEVRWP